MNRVFLLAALASPFPVLAQGVAAPTVALEQIVLPANTEVVVTPNDTITTKGRAIKEGYKFCVATMYDVMQNGVVMIPKGTPGEGTVSWMTNKGAFGKSGKMEVSFDWLELGGRRLALTGSHRQEGEGNTVATVAVAVAATVFSALVTGRSATITNGTQLRARTAEAIAFNVPQNAARVTTGTLAPVAAAATVSPTATVR